MVTIYPDVLVEFVERREKQKMRSKIQPEQELLFKIVK
jgi:hypothetical protein